MAPVWLVLSCRRLRISTLQFSGPELMTWTQDERKDRRRVDDKQARKRPLGGNKTQLCDRGAPWLVRPCDSFARLTELRHDRAVWYAGVCHRSELRLAYQSPLFTDDRSGAQTERL